MLHSPSSGGVFHKQRKEDWIKIMTILADNLRTAKILTDNLRSHFERNHRVRMAAAKGDWNEYDRIVEECIEQAENKLGQIGGTDGNRINLEGIEN